MTQTPENTQTPPAKPAPRQHLLASWLLVGLGMLLVAVVLWNYRVAQEFAFMRNTCIIAGVVGALGVAISFGGAMHYLDLALRPGALRWYWRMVLIAEKRLLLLVQILGMGVAVGAIGLLFFDLPVPGSDRAVPDRHWQPEPPSITTGAPRPSP